MRRVVSQCKRMDDLAFFYHQEFTGVLVTLFRMSNDSGSIPDCSFHHNPFFSLQF